MRADNQLVALCDCNRLTCLYLKHLLNVGKEIIVRCQTFWSREKSVNRPINTHQLQESQTNIEKTRKMDRLLDKL